MDVIKLEMSFHSSDGNAADIKGWNNAQTSNYQQNYGSPIASESILNSMYVTNAENINDHQAVVQFGNKYQKSTHFSENLPYQSNNMVLDEAFNGYKRLMPPQANTNFFFNNADGSNFYGDKWSISKGSSDSQNYFTSDCDSLSKNYSNLQSGSYLQSSSKENTHKLATYIKQETYPHILDLDSQELVVPMFRSTEESDGSKEQTYEVENKLNPHYMMQSVRTPFNSYKNVQDHETSCLTANTSYERFIPELESGPLKSLNYVSENRTNALNVGMETNMGNTNIKFDNGACQSSLNNSQTVKTPCKSNRATKPKTYNCVACNKWFTSSGHLKRHYNTILHKNSVKLIAEVRTSSFQNILPKNENKKDPTQQKNPNKSLNKKNGLSKNTTALESQGSNTEEAQKNCYQIKEENYVHMKGQQNIEQLKKYPQSVCLERHKPTLIQSNNQNENDVSHIKVQNIKQEWDNEANIIVSTPLLTAVESILPRPINIPYTDDIYYSYSNVPNHFNLKNSNEILEREPSFTTNYFNNFDTNYFKDLNMFNVDNNFGTNQHIQTNQGVTSIPLPAFSSTLKIPHSINQIVQPLFDEQNTEDTSTAPQAKCEKQNLAISPSTALQVQNWSSPPNSTKSTECQQPANSSNIIDNSSKTMQNGIPENSILPLLQMKTIQSRCIKCIECNKEFTRICYLTQHNKSFHSGQQPFRCQQCGKRFHSEVIYSDHVTKHKSLDKPFKCDLCPKQFYHKTDLRRHKEAIHTGLKVHICGICQKSFCRGDHLRKHYTTHKKKKKITFDQSKEIRIKTSKIIVNDKKTENIVNLYSCDNREKVKHEVFDT